MGNRLIEEFISMQSMKRVTVYIRLVTKDRIHKQKLELILGRIQ